MTHPLVEETYTDAFGERRTVEARVRDAVLAAMRSEARAERNGSIIGTRGASLPSAGELTLEDGTQLGRVSAVPRDLPFGYHRLRTDDGHSRLVITGPGRCHLPGIREWGWAIQLATLRSRRSWGIGDLDDLAELSRWSARAGAGFVAVGPLGAPNPGPSPEPSPYYPSTRRFGNPLHVAIDQLPGAEALEDLRTRARALNENRLVDRHGVAALKREALERTWRGAAFDRDEFERWRAERGQALERWAVFCVLTERFGPGWQSWPEPYRRPAGREVAREAADRSERVTFHAWVQWCFDGQLRRASTPLRRIADMPVGVDPGGFDAWDWQEQLAMDARVGAPPDRFNTAGQDWGLPPFVPDRLDEAGYRPFIDTIRAQLRHAAGLRIDHVLGLFRLWCIPHGHSPAEGAYVRYPTDALLEVVALESHRAQAVVVGEDLGTVPAGVRAELRRRRLLSTRLALFETRPPERWPRRSFAAVTTHDLPTVAGIWSGADLRDQAASGLEPEEASVALLRRRLARTARVGADAGDAEVTLALHERLAAAPPMLVAATLEDAVGVEERPNLPGTVAGQRDNWSIALPVTLDEIQSQSGVASVVRALDRGR